jgi:hypothetical protein
MRVAFPRHAPTGVLAQESDWANPSSFVSDEVPHCLVCTSRAQSEIPWIILSYLTYSYEGWVQQQWSSPITVRSHGVPLSSDLQARHSWVRGLDIRNRPWLATTWAAKMLQRSPPCQPTGREDRGRSRACLDKSLVGFATRDLLPAPHSCDFSMTQRKLPYLSTRAFTRLRNSS